MRSLAATSVVCFLLWGLVLGIGVQEHSPKLHIQFVNAKIPANAAEQFALDDAHDNQNYEILRSEAQNYLCHIPHKEQYWSANYQVVPAANLTFELRRNETFLQQALDEIYHTFGLNNCIYVYNLHSGYWTYGYCFGDKIIQFHENLLVFQLTGQHIAEFPNHVYVLGRFKNEKGSYSSSKQQKSGLIQNQSLWKGNNLKTADFSIIDSDVSPFTGASMSELRSQRYIQQSLKMGGICDITNKPRTIEVLYKCDPDSLDAPNIVDTLEVTTCQYQMVISVPGLCKIPELRPHGDEEEITPITCKSIGKEVKDSPSVKFSEYNEIPEPQPKLSLGDMNLIPLGNRFSLGTFKEQPENSLYPVSRMVLVYSGLTTSSHDFLSLAGKMFEKLMETKLAAPVFDGAVQLPLLYQDNFILWFEIYDFYGNFTKLLRVQRDAKEPKNRFYLALVDPESFLDQDGDRFDRPNLPGPFPIWNYETFSRQEEKKELEVEQKVKQEGEQEEQQKGEQAAEQDEAETYTETSTVTVVHTATVVEENVHDEL